MADFVSGFGGIGGAVSDLFAAKGQRQAASGYDRAAGLADQSADLSVAAGKIKVKQVQRDAYQLLGGQQADIASAGFTTGGSAGDIIRDSMAEASMAAGLASTQANINTNDFVAQASSYRSQAQQARSQAQGLTFGGVIKGIAGIASFFI